MPEMPCTPTQTSHGSKGAASGTKRRRRSRRGEQLCADPALATKRDGVGEPLCRRPRVGSPALRSRSSPLCQARPKPPSLIEAPICSPPAFDPEAARKAEESALLRGLKTVVITLERRPDRMQGCAQRFAAVCPDLGYEKLTAVDGRQTAISSNLVTTSWDTTENVVYQRLRSERKGWDDLHTYHERVLDLSPGERGCAASHILAWRQCAASGSDAPLLVLEDDAAPMPNFGGILKKALTALPRDAGVLYLGYSQAAHWRREISEEVVEAEYVWTTVGYIIWPAAARLLLSKLPVNQPVDNFMAQLCATGDLKAYCIRPKIIRQADAWNCGSDIRHSDEQYWGPDSDIIHSEVAPAPRETERPIPGAIADDGSSFWDLGDNQEEQIV